MARLRAGDAAAFDAVYDAFNLALFSFLARLSNSRDVAEDLAEKTWLRLVVHAARLQPDTRLGPWLFTVARNLHASYRRSRLLEDLHAPGLLGLAVGLVAGRLRSRLLKRASLSAVSGCAWVAARIVS